MLVLTVKIAYYILSHVSSFLKKAVDMCKGTVMHLAGTSYSMLPYGLCSYLIYNTYDMDMLHDILTIYIANDRNTSTLKI